MARYYVRFIDADGDEDGGEVEAISLDDAIDKYKQLLQEHGCDSGKNQQFRTEPVTPIHCRIRRKLER